MMVKNVTTMVITITTDGWLLVEDGSLRSSRSSWQMISDVCHDYPLMPFNDGFN